MIDIPVLPPKTHSAKRKEKRRAEAEKERRAVEAKYHATIQRAAGEAQEAGTLCHQINQGLIETRIGRAMQGRVAGVTFKRARNQPPLEEYLARGTISIWQCQAGKQLHADWFYAGLSGYRQMITEYRDVHYELRSNEKRIDAIDRYIGAIRALSSEFLRDIAWYVCCREENLGEKPYASYTRGINAKPRLLEALDELMAHYEKKTLDEAKAKT